MGRKADLTARLQGTFCTKPVSLRLYAPSAYALCSAPRPRRRQSVARLRDSVNGISINFTKRCAPLLAWHGGDQGDVTSSIGVEAGAGAQALRSHATLSLVRSLESLRSLAGTSPLELETRTP